LGEGSLEREAMEKVRQYAFRISQHIIVPVSRDLKSFSAQQIIACPISHRGAVLASVNFKNHLPLEADKIEDVVS